MHDISLIGQPIDRTDGHLKVTGGARYSAEINLPGMVYAVLIGSTIGRGTITGIDTAAAEQAAGVLAILTHLNMPKLPPPAPKPAQGVERKLSLLQDDVVYYNGQPIGVAVADSLERALYAASLVKATYQSEPPITGFEAHLHDGYAPKNVGGQKAPTDTQKQEGATALAAAPTRVEQVYTTPIENHNPMEPHATIATWDGDRLTLFDATQGIHTTQERVAQLFNLPPDHVRVICHYVGGGFGCKGPVWSNTMLAAMCARQVGKPVKLVLERPQMFNNTGARPETHQSLALGAAADGTLAALHHDSISHTSVFDEFTETAAQQSRMLYAVPNILTSHRLVQLNLGTPSFMRAPGEASGTFGLESGMDEMAYALKMDPIELRLKNYAETDPDEKKPFSSKSLRECYKVGAERFGWDRRQASPAPRSVRDGRWLVGYGMATATYPVRRSASNALARINADGTALVQAGTQDLGTGTWTVMTQVAAQFLGLPMEKVRFELGDSKLPVTPVSGGSQTAASTGSAVQAAALAAISKLTQLAIGDGASPLHGAAEADVAAENGRLFLKADSTKGETYAALLNRARLPAIEAKADAKPGEEKQKFSMHSFGAQFAEVRVDPDLGLIRVAKWTGIFGVGHLLNAKTARSQLIGGIVFGIGMALMEETVPDGRDARIVNANLAEYLVPVNADVPEIDVAFVHEDDPYVNPMGVKGIGEIGITGACAALANAVYHATGVRVRDLPIRLDKLV
jgi:xanthine dehydrogenase YagR molybdenum-binding subunit